jgi:anti-sigma regulatory factor (Ser/Thr protein kinase)
MLELSLHILDIAENSTRAGAKTVRIDITEDEAQDRLIIEIRDDGAGMDEETLGKALDPFFTSKKVRRVGLGLPMLAEAAERTGGRFEIESAVGGGTRVRVEFRHSHIDRQPLGDIPGTFMTLIAGNPGVNFEYRHRKGRGTFTLDTGEIREELDGVPINNAEVLQFLRNRIREGLADIGVSNH